MAFVARGQAKLMKQVEGRGQYAHVVLRLTVDGPDTGVIIANSLLTHVIPAEYISPIEAGIRSVIDDGKLAERGYSGARVELIDGSYHNVDSSNTAFFSAAHRHGGCAEAAPAEANGRDRRRQLSRGACTSQPAAAKFRGSGSIGI